MPKLEVEGVGEVDVEEGKRLVLAIEEDAGWTSSTASVHKCENRDLAFRALLFEGGTERLELARA